MRNDTQFLFFVQTTTTFHIFTLSHLQYLSVLQWGYFFGPLQHFCSWPVRGFLGETKEHCPMGCQFWPAPGSARRRMMVKLHGCIKANPYIVGGGGGEVARTMEHGHTKVEQVTQLLRRAIFKSKKI